MLSSKALELLGQGYKVSYFYLSGRVCITDGHYDSLLEIPIGEFLEAKNTILKLIGETSYNFKCQNYILA